MYIIKYDWIDYEGFVSRGVTERYKSGLEVEGRLVDLRESKEASNIEIIWNEFF